MIDSEHELAARDAFARLLDPDLFGKVVLTAPSAVLHPAAVLRSGRRTAPGADHRPRWSTAAGWSNGGAGQPRVMPSQSGQPWCRTSQAISP